MKSITVVGMASIATFVLSIVGSLILIILALIGVIH